MRKRRAMKKTKAKRLFRNTAGQHPKNKVRPMAFRGGIRL